MDILFCGTHVQKNDAVIIFCKFLGFAAFASEMKIVDFFAKKSSHFSKMDIYFCPFFQSASISFSDFYYLWDI